MDEAPKDKISKDKLLDGSKEQEDAAKTIQA